MRIVALAALIGCGGDSGGARDARPMMDGSGEIPKSFVQIEHLARPGINEVFLLWNDLNATYNAAAPTFSGVPAEVLTQVKAQAQTVMKALYLGACLVNGVTTADLRPANITCHATGAGLFTTGDAVTGVTLTATSMQKAQEYADAVYNGFIPDVMRVDLSINPSSYESPCGAGTANTPFLCGGRFLDDDTIDTTYDFLLNGARVTLKGDLAVYTQTSALVSDGVSFRTPPGNRDSRTPASAANSAQFHPPVSSTFPYAANPL